MRGGAPPARSVGLTPDDIAAIWHSINPKIVPYRGENEYIATAASYWGATAACVTEQNRPELAKARETLSAWCRQYRRKTEEIAKPIATEHPDLYRELEPRLFDERMLALERALLNVGDLVKPLPPRQKEWVIIVPPIYSGAKGVLERCHGSVGTSPRSYAVRFTTAMLRKLGYEVTEDAVAPVVRRTFGVRQNSKDFCD
jgi:hypothetical protein